MQASPGPIYAMRSTNAVQYTSNMRTTPRFGFGSSTRPDAASIARASQAPGPGTYSDTYTDLGASASRSLSPRSTRSQSPRHKPMARQSGARTPASSRSAAGLVLTRSGARIGAGSQPGRADLRSRPGRVRHAPGRAGVVAEAFSAGVHHSHRRGGARVRHGAPARPLLPRPHDRHWSSAARARRAGVAGAGAVRDARQDALRGRPDGRRALLLDLAAPGARAPLHLQAARLLAAGDAQPRPRHLHAARDDRSRQLHQLEHLDARAHFLLWQREAALPKRVKRCGSALSVRAARRAARAEA